MKTLIGVLSMNGIKCASEPWVVECVCICVRTCSCADTCVMCACVRAYVCVHVVVRVRVRICVHVRVRVRVYVRACSCGVRVYVRACSCVCVYVVCACTCWCVCIVFLDITPWKRVANCQPSFGVPPRNLFNPRHCSTGRIEAVRAPCRTIYNLDYLHILIVLGEYFTSNVDYTNILRSFLAQFIKATTSVMRNNSSNLQVFNKPTMDTSVMCIFCTLLS